MACWGLFGRPPALCGSLTTGRATAVRLVTCQYCQNIIDNHLCRTPPFDGTPADPPSRDAPKLPPFVPLAEGVVRYNGGTRCDMEHGPCSCGATHDASGDAPKGEP